MSGKQDTIITTTNGCELIWNEEQREVIFMLKRKEPKIDPQLGTALPIQWHCIIVVLKGKFGEEVIAGSEEDMIAITDSQLPDMDRAAQRQPAMTDASFLRHLARILFNYWNSRRENPTPDISDNPLEW